MYEPDKQDLSEQPKDIGRRKLNLFRGRSKKTKSLGDVGEKPKQSEEKQSDVPSVPFSHLFRYARM